MWRMQEQAVLPPQSQGQLQVDRLWSLIYGADFSLNGRRERQSDREDRLCGSLFLSVRCTGRKHTQNIHAHIYICMLAHRHTKHQHTQTHNKTIYCEKVFFFFVMADGQTTLLSKK